VVIAGIKVARHLVKVSSKLVEFIYEVFLVNYQNNSIIKTEA